MFQRFLFVLVGLISSVAVMAQEDYAAKKITIDASLKQAEHFKNAGDLKEATRYLNTAAMHTWEEKNYADAITYFQQSIALNQQLKNESGIAKLHSNLAMIYSDLRDYEKSLSYFQLALDYRLKHGEPSEIISTYINKSVVLNNLKRHSEAAKNLEEALLLATQTTDDSQMKSCYGMLSETYEKAGNQEKAIEYFHLYRTFHEREQRERSKAVRREADQAKLTALQLELQKKEQALQLIEASRELRHNEAELKNMSTELRALYDSTTKHELAMRVLKHELELEQAKIAQVEAKHHAQRLWTGIAILCCLMVLFSVILLYRNYHYKKKTNQQLNVQNESIRQLNENLEEEVEKRTAELTQTLSHLEKRNRELDQFSHVISHNLRGPVARILGLGKVLNRDNPSDPMNVEVFDRMVLATKNLDGVVKDLTVIIQVHDNQSIPKEKVALAPLFESAKELLNTEIEGTQANIGITLNNIKHVTLVKPYFESIMYNLLSNAIKYRSPERKPHIQINTQLSDNKFLLTLKDNGVGIEEENLSKIFEPYKRLTLDGEGKGLGLYLVRTHVEAMGGTINVTSSPNKSTTFIIEIPQL